MYVWLTASGWVTGGRGLSLFLLSFFVAGTVCVCVVDGGVGVCVGIGGIVTDGGGGGGMVVAVAAAILV